MQKLKYLSLVGLLAASHAWCMQELAAGTDSEASTSAPANPELDEKNALQQEIANLRAALQQATEGNSALLDDKNRLIIEKEQVEATHARTLADNAQQNQQIDELTQALQQTADQQKKDAASNFQLIQQLKNAKIRHNNIATNWNTLHMQPQIDAATRQRDTHAWRHNVLQKFVAPGAVAAGVWYAGRGRNPKVVVPAALAAAGATFKFGPKVLSSQWARTSKLTQGWYPLALCYAYHYQMIDLERKTIGLLNMSDCDTDNSGTDSDSDDSDTESVDPELDADLE